MSHPVGMMAAMEGSPALRFAATAKVLGRAARARGLAVPGFRSPPAIAGCDRTIRRRPDAPPVVAVALRDRPWAAVVADMVEGVVVANGLGAHDAIRCRSALWEALAAEGTLPSGAAA